MKFFAKVEEIWRVICGVAAVVWRGFCKVMEKIGKVLKTIGVYIYKLRGLLMVMPVIIAAVILACYNLNHLGPNVGLNLQVDGGFETVVSRGTAVLVPLGITGVCVALTVISRKPLYPWLISVFSLVLPVLIYVVNMYPV